jgi:TonB family protein
MRVFGKLALLTVVAGLAGSSSAFSQPPAASAFDVGPDWLIKPDPAMIGSFYPVGAAMKRLTGSAKVRCVVATDGSLKDCAVMEETPAGAAFGAAALEVAANAKMKPATKAGQPVESTVVVPVSFDIPPVMVTNPDWLKKPTPDDVSRYYPPEAIAQAKGGMTSIRCRVALNGRLTSCRVISEFPAGYGFGKAALSMSGTFVMKPRVVEDTPVDGAQVVVPIAFVCPYCSMAPTPSTLHVYRLMPWAAVPTLAEMAAAFPDRAVKAKVDSGSVTLQCNITADGHLRACDVTSESPSGRGFGAAARTLAADFQAPTAPSGSPLLKNSAVIFTVGFANPKAEKAERLTGKVRILEGIRGADAIAAMPAKAKDAGITSAEAILGCIVQGDGHVVCTVDSETPQGFGFGEAAVGLSSKIRADIWSEEGLPTIGAPVRVLISFKTQPQSAAARK